MWSMFYKTLHKIVWYNVYRALGRLPVVITVKVTMITYTFCAGMIYSNKLSTSIYTFLYMQSKIKRVPRGIRGEKSSKVMASSRNLFSTIGAQASPKMGGTELGVRNGKRFLLACQPVANAPWKPFKQTIHNSMKVKLNMKVKALFQLKDMSIKNVTT